VLELKASLSLLCQAQIIVVGVACHGQTRKTVRNKARARDHATSRLFISSSCNEKPAVNMKIYVFFISVWPEVSCSCCDHFFVGYFSIFNTLLINKFVT